MTTPQLHHRLGHDPAMLFIPIGDWPERVNAALDEWEDQARTTGPRVETFDDAGGKVSVRMRADA